MFCPKCQYEYRVGFHVCPDCDEELVEELPGVNEEFHPDGSFVPLPNLPGRVFAEMVKGALEERGIPCYIHGYAAGGVLRTSGTGAPSGSVQLYVPKDKYQECIDIQHQMVDHI